MPSLRVATSLALLLATTPARADDAPRTLGLGVALNTGVVDTNVDDFGNDLPVTQLFIPIRLSEHLRLEPSFGWMSGVDEWSSGETRLRELAAGLGLLALAPLTPRAQAYVGARTTLVWVKRESSHPPPPPSVGAMTMRFVAFAGVLGAEALFGDVLSVGIEGQVQYFTIGDRTYEGGDETTTEKGGHVISTEGLLVFRAYLF